MYIYILQCCVLSQAQEQAAQRAQQSRQEQQQQPQQQAPPGGGVGNTPFGLGSLGGLSGMAGMGMGSANFMDMQQRMQTEVSDTGIVG